MIFYIDIDRFMIKGENDYCANDDGWISSAYAICHTKQNAPLVNVFYRSRELGIQA